MERKEADLRICGACCSQLLTANRSNNCLQLVTTNNYFVFFDLFTVSNCEQFQTSSLGILRLFLFIFLINCLIHYKFSM